MTTETLWDWTEWLVSVWALLAVIVAPPTFAVWVWRGETQEDDE